MKGVNQSGFTGRGFLQGVGLQGSGFEVFGFQRRGSPPASSRDSCTAAYGAESTAEDPMAIVLLGQLFKQAFWLLPEV